MGFFPTERRVAPQEPDEEDTAPAGAAVAALALGGEVAVAPSVVWRIKDGLYVIEGMEKILPPVGPQTQKLGRHLVMDEVVHLFLDFNKSHLDRPTVERVLEAYVIMKQQAKFEEMWKVKHVRKRDGANLQELPSHQESHTHMCSACVCQSHEVPHVPQGRYAHFQGEAGGHFSCG